MKKNLLLLLWCFLVYATKMAGQDPHFSQFFMAPHQINPANTGIQYGDWMILGNFRQQWSNAGTAFMTQSLTGEWKLKGGSEHNDKIGLNVDEDDVIAVGATFMNDQSMYGTFKSNYLSLSLAYHKSLGENHRLALGVQGYHGRRRLDYEQLTFGEQFSSRGYDVTLPSGESALQSMKPFTAIATGLLYTFSKPRLNIDLGIAGYELNSPKQSFLNDENQVLLPRYNAQLQVQYLTDRYSLLHLNGIYQKQLNQGYFAVGGAMGWGIQESWRKMLFAGLWFRSGDAFYPYTAYKINDIIIGLSYDITYSKQNYGPVSPRSFELSFIFTNTGSTRGYLECAPTRIPYRFQTLPTDFK